MPRGSGKSLINATRLRGVAEAVGLGGSAALDIVVRDLGGADIGCRGVGRTPTRSKNAPSAFEFPGQVTEAIAVWLQKGFAFGPVEEGELEEGVKVNGIMCRQKPDGGVRIILNLSAPAGRSVNDGIDPGQFEAVMSSTRKWLRVLHRAGRGCLMTKLDWSDAYKHISVRDEDVQLQYFEWLGKYFAETSLVFGAASSPGIYDRVAKMVLQVALRLANFPADLVCQHLDDVCAAGAADGEGIRRFEDRYRALAADIGVRLAPLDDPNKAFSCCTRGVVLGIEYNTVAWTWAVPQEKLVRLIHQLRRALAETEIVMEDLWSLVGRLLHYAPIVPGGRFALREILVANSVSVDRKAMIGLPPSAKRQLQFWELMLRVCSGWAHIPPFAGSAPAWAVDFYTDAAGGSMEGGWRGCGGVSGDWWFVCPWPSGINNGSTRADGKKLGRKLSALELVGPLLCLLGDPGRCRNQAVRILVDNSGSVAIWKKGYSMRCWVSSRVVEALAAVAAGLNCRVWIEKVERCSVPGAVVADCLSKGDWRGAKSVAALDGVTLEEEPGGVSKAVLRWLSGPREEDDLAQAVLSELCLRTSVLGYNCVR